MGDPPKHASPDGSPVPPEIPDLDLLRPIGRGGFGEVWLAANRTTGHLRAVKLIPLERSGTADPAGREITSLTRLEANLQRQHPNLLTIHHVGKTADHLFYVMDAADDLSGGPASSDPGYQPATLQRRLEGGPLGAERCLGYAEQLLTGLASLHEAGMVHRDVKPANCLLVHGELKLADFGLVAEADRQASRVGTRGYMPPDGRMDTRADVYAAGLVIYEMLTALPPDRFPRLGPRAHELDESPLLGALVRLVLRACDPDPKRRFRDAREMLAELKGWELPAAAPRWRSRRPWILSIAAVAIAAGLAAIVWWATRPPRVDVNFLTAKPHFDAEIYLDDVRQETADGAPCTTPCTIKDLPARVHRVKFKREGLPDLDYGPVDFAQTRQIVGRWGQSLNSE